MENLTELTDKLKNAVLLVRCGDMDISKDGKIVDDHRLLELLRHISKEITLMPHPDLSHWPSEQKVEESIFWLRACALLAEYLAKRPNYKDEIILPNVDVDLVFTNIESLIDDPNLPQSEGLIDRLRLLRGAIRCLLFRIGEVYRFNDNTETELESVISSLNRLSEFADKVLSIDRYHSNYSLKAEIFYYKGRAERGRGRYSDAERSFADCLRLARKRVERYEGDPGEADNTKEYRHSAYLAARTILQLAFLGYLQGNLSGSRRLITASWFIVHNCHDRFTKAEIQFTTAAIRRALTTDKSKLEGIGKVLKEADQTLGELGHYQIQQTVKNESVLCYVYQEDFEEAQVICQEMSHLAETRMIELRRASSYWMARAKKLLAITYIHQYEDEKSPGSETIKKAIKYAEAALKTLNNDLPYCRNEIVVALCIQAQAHISRFARQLQSDSGQFEQRLGDSKKADELLREAEQKNYLVERPPGFGEMNSQHNRGIIALLRSRLFLEKSDVLSAEYWLRSWETDIAFRVETQWLHDLAKKLRQRMPQQQKVVSIDPNRTFDDLCKEVAKEQYELIKLQLKQSGQRHTNSEIARRMDISEASLRRYGVIKTERPHKKKAS